jgi:hypothetical protein
LCVFRVNSNENVNISSTRRNKCVGQQPICTFEVERNRNDKCNIRLATTAKVNWMVWLPIRIDSVKHCWHRRSLAKPIFCLWEITGTTRAFSFASDQKAGLAEGIQPRIVVYCELQIMALLITSRIGRSPALRLSEEDGLGEDDSNSSNSKLDTRFLISRVAIGRQRSGLSWAKWMNLRSLTAQ